MPYRTSHLTTLHGRAHHPTLTLAASGDRERPPTSQAEVATPHRRCYQTRRGRRERKCTGSLRTDELSFGRAAMVTSRPTSTRDPPEIYRRSTRDLPEIHPGPAPTDGSDGPDGGDGPPPSLRPSTPICAAGSRRRCLPRRRTTAAGRRPPRRRAAMARAARRPTRRAWIVPRRFVSVWGIPRLHLADTSAASRLHLGCNSHQLGDARPRLYLGSISAISRLYLASARGCTSATVSRLHLGYISAISRISSGIHVREAAMKFWRRE